MSHFSSAGGSRRGVGAAQVLLAASLWGTTGTVAQFAPPGANPLAIGAGTMGVGGVLLWLTGGRPVRPGGGAGLMVAGTLAVAVYPLAFYTSMALAGVAVGTVVTVGSGPVFAAIYERVLDRRPLGMRWMVATALALLGCGVLVLHGTGSTGGGPAVVGGVGLGLLAGASYAAYSYLAARAMAGGMSSPTVMGTMFGLASLVLLPVLVLCGDALLTRPSGLVVLGYLALIPMGLAYVLFGRGLAVTPASVATTLALIEPVVAAVLSVVVLGERQGAVGWFGIVCVGAGLAVLTVSGRQRQGGECGRPGRNGRTRAPSSDAQQS